MNSKYLIVLFKNKVRYKIIKKYQTYKKCKEYFDFLLKKSDSVLFETQIENGKDCLYEIGLISKEDVRKPTLFKQDELGRNIKVETDDSDFQIIELKKFSVSEKIFDLKNNKKVECDNIIEKLVRGKTLKLISKLNNKIVVQEDNLTNLYSLKNEYDSNRFITTLEKYVIDNKKRNCLIVKDESKEQKKYMYELLSNLGYDKEMLYRKHTTYSKDK